MINTWRGASLKDARMHEQIPRKEIRSNLSSPHDTGSADAQTCDAQ